MPTTVRELWRYPVKSTGGQRLDEVVIGRRGVHADRLWAVWDVEHDITASARRMPALLTCTARYIDEPGPDAGPGRVPPVTIAFPDGCEYHSADPAVHLRLSETVGREVRLVALARVEDTSQQRLSVKRARNSFSMADVRRDFGLAAGESLPDTSIYTAKQLVTMARFTSPPGTFYDLSVIHVLSEQSLASLADGDDEPYDARRFRPNVLVCSGDAEERFPEANWVGQDLRIGKLTLSVTNPTVRCVVPTRAQPGLATDRGLTRRLAQTTDRYLGVYADVSTAGVVRVGDEVVVVDRKGSWLMRRGLTAAARTTIRHVQRWIEATVLRDH